jgi:molybdate transport system substrate-binding protein
LVTIVAFVPRWLGRPVVALALLASCSSGASSTEHAPTGSITVFAASSLTDAFTELGARFEDAHPGTKVTFSFAASSTLAAQVVQGAPADVLATADTASMQAARGSTGTPRDFARNVLEIAVPTGNPRSVHGIDDFRSGLSYAICDPAVPCGRYAAMALAKAGIDPEPKSYETNVRNVLARVTSGEVDAGIVYHTDVDAAEGTAEGVEISFSDDPDLRNVYPIATTEQDDNAALARAWVRYVLSPAGQRVLRSFAFLPPPG